MTERTKIQRGGRLNLERSVLGKFTPGNFTPGNFTNRNLTPNWRRDTHAGRAGVAVADDSNNQSTPVAIRRSNDRRRLLGGKSPQTSRQESPGESLEESPGGTNVRVDPLNKAKNRNEI